MVVNYKLLRIMRFMNLTDLTMANLNAFVAVVSSGSVTEAARLTARSQPSITRAVQELEAALGFQLFYRKGPRINITPEGVQFYNEAQRVLNGLRLIGERAVAISRAAPKPFEIAAIPAFASTLLPEALARVDAALLPHKYLLNQMPAENVLQSVAQGSADLGVSSFPLDHPGIDVLWAAEAGCVVVVHENSPLAGEDRVTLKQLEGVPLIATSNPFRLRPRLEELFAQHGQRFAPAIDTTASLPAMAAVRAGLGVAIIDPISAYGCPMRGVVVRQLSHSVTFRFAVVVRSAAPVRPVLVEFSNKLHDVAQAILPDFKRVTSWSVEKKEPQRTTRKKGLKQ